MFIFAFVSPALGSLSLQAVGMYQERVHGERELPGGF